MKIVHVISGIPNPHEMNGVNVIVHNLATQQLDAGYDVTVCAITNKTETVHEHSYEILLFKELKSRFWLAPELKQYLCGLGPDTIVHLHSVFIPELWAVSRILKKMKIRYILSPHGAFHQKALSRHPLRKKIYITFFESRILNDASAIHASGKNEIDEIKSLTSNSSIYLLQNGVNLPEDLRPERDTSGCTNIVFLGRLVKEHKGLDLLLNAFKEVSGQADVKLVMAGDGPDRRELEEFVEEHNLSEKVIFCGPLFGRDKIELFKQTDIFVHTSRWDGMPTGVVEAAAYNIPLLVSEATNLGAFVEKYNAGCVCMKNDVPDIVENMMKMISCPENYKDNSIKMIKSEFLWKHVTAEHTELYIKVLGNEFTL